MAARTEREEPDLQKEPLTKLIRGGELYGPDYRGQGDLLVVGGIIARIAPGIPVPRDFLEVQIVEAAGQIITPGFIDQHVHMIGAGGSAGPLSRTREIKIQQITAAGVTTAAGVLGLDDITTDLKRLLVKARGLEEQGITTFVYTGSYVLPSPTLTGSIETDLILIRKVVGVKLALGESASTYPSETELKNLVTAARRGGSLAGKAGIIHIHMGPNPGLYYRMVERVLTDAMIPMTQVIFTHAGRSSSIFEGALEYARKGGLVDVTACQNPEFQPERVAGGLKKPSRAIEEMLQAGISEKQITLSSDSNAGGMGPDGRMRYSSIDYLHKEFRDLAIGRRNIPLALKMVTVNPAERLGILSSKGTLEEGKDADLLIMTPDLRIKEVYARGKVMVHEGQPVVQDPFP